MTLIKSTVLLYPLWSKPFYKHPELLLCIHKVIWCILTIGRCPADRYQLYALIPNRLIQFPL